MGLFRVDWLVADVIVLVHCIVDDSCAEVRAFVVLAYHQGVVCTQLCKHSPVLVDLTRVFVFVYRLSEFVVPEDGFAIACNDQLALLHSVSYSCRP